MSWWGALSGLHCKLHGSSFGCLWRDEIPTWNVTCRSVMHAKASVSACYNFNDFWHIFRKSSGFRCSESSVYQQDRSCREGWREVHVGRQRPKGITVVQQSELRLSGKYDFMPSKFINYSAKYQEIQYVFVISFFKVHNFHFTLFSSVHCYEINHSCYTNRCTSL